MDEKKNNCTLGENEPYDTYFLRLISNNLDIPKEHFDKFTIFVDQQADAFQKIKIKESKESKKALELGFENVCEYREHLRKENDYRKRLEIAQIEENKNHLLNVYATEDLFIKTNLQDVESIYPRYSNRCIIGVHSHQILFDIIFQTCRIFNRSTISSIMDYFGVVDIAYIREEIED